MLNPDSVNLGLILASFSAPITAGIIKLVPKRESKNGNNGNGSNKIPEHSHPEYIRSELCAANYRHLSGWLGTIAGNVDEMRKEQQDTNRLIIDVLKNHKPGD